MGASKEKKKRIEAAQAGTVKVNTFAVEEEKKRKKFKVTAIIVAAVVVVAAILIIIASTNFFYQNAVAVKAGNTTYSIADFNYFYTAKYNEYQSYFGDMSSMSDYITGNAVRDGAVYDMEKYAMYAEKAASEGVELSEAGKKRIEDQISDIASYASVYGFTTDKYLQQIFGKGMTEEIFRKNASLVELASEYGKGVYDSFEYDAAKLAESYDKDAYDMFEYNVFSFYQSAQSGAADPAAAVDGLAQEFAERVSAGESFNDLCIEYSEGYDKYKYELDDTACTVHNQGSTLNVTYESWLKEEAEPGDIGVFSDDAGAYVVQFISRDGNEYNAVSVREIYFLNDVAYSDFDSVEEYEAAHEQKAAELLANAESTFDQWEEGEMTEESFAGLANAYSESTLATDGGLLDPIPRNAYAAEINDWCYDSARTAGDTTIISTHDGVYILYFVGGNDMQYRDYIVDSNLRSADFTAWEDAESAPYEAKRTMFFGFGN